MLMLLALYFTITLITIVSLFMLFIIHDGMIVREHKDSLNIYIFAYLVIILMGFLWPIFAILIFIGWIFEKTR